MSNRNRSLVFSFFFTLLIAGAAFYLFAIKKPLPSVRTELFLPTEVIKFNWKFKEASFSFQKNPSDGNWSPAVDTDRLARKIEMLSKLDPQPITPSDFDLENGLTVTLAFTDGSIWSAVLSQDFLIWLSGPMINSGTKLSPVDLQIMHEGRFAFEPHTWDWCADNLRKITYEMNEEAIEIQRTGDDWEITNLNGESKIVESTWIEAWIEKSCRVKIDAWIDLDIEPFGLDDGSFELEKSDGSHLEYSVRTPTFQITKEKAALSPSLFQNLEELMQAP